jgi:shikimate kinase
MIDSMITDEIKNIYLIGPMGSGKSTVARFLAKLCCKSIVDSDEEIIRQTGVDISWIFDKEGEAGFRKRETKVIKYLTAMENIILATGGGVVVKEENRRCLQETGLVIYLQVSPIEEMERISRRKGVRPLLATHDSPDKLLALNSARYPLYEEIADITYDTDQRTPQEIARIIYQEINRSDKKNNA